MHPTVTYRHIEKIVQGQITSDGAGVRLTRVLTKELQHRLDPFLMLDHFCNENPDDYMGGFPNHPHRGFETFTYMIAGKMRHQDSAGHEGLLESGGAQWMLTGRGLIHSELPEQEDGLMEGFQLWLNLPAKNKMDSPKYKDISSQSIPEIIEDRVKIRILMGKYLDVSGAIERHQTEPLFLDVHLPEDKLFQCKIPSGFNALIYAYNGTITIQNNTLNNKNMAILSNDADHVLVTAQKDSRFLVIAGKPLHEPIVQYGPFVMNTVAEIQQTFLDYKNGAFLNHEIILL